MGRGVYTEKFLGGFFFRCFLLVLILKVFTSSGLPLGPDSKRNMTDFGCVTCTKHASESKEDSSTSGLPLSPDSKRNMTDFGCVTCTKRASENKACPTSWVPYKDESCLKIFETDFKTYGEAESLCKKNNDARLLSVELLEKQKFLEDLLKSKNLDRNIWIGLKNLGGNQYGWSDGTSLNFINWNHHHVSPDSMRNMTDFGCVTCTRDSQPAASTKIVDHVSCIQLRVQSRGSDFGKWEREYCNRTNLVACEKVQSWTQERLQIKLMNKLRNAVPIGYVYVQLPNLKSPSKLWPWMVWEDVSHDYNSVFFRALGKASGKFNEVQEESFPTWAIKYGKGEPKTSPDSMRNMTDFGCVTCTRRVLDVPLGDWSPKIEYQPRGPQQRSEQMMQIKKDLAPRNMAITVWKRKY